MGVHVGARGYIPADEGSFASDLRFPFVTIH